MDSHTHHDSSYSFVFIQIHRTNVEEREEVLGRIIRNNSTIKTRKII